MYVDFPPDERRNIISAAVGKVRPSDSCQLLVETLLIGRVEHNDAAAFDNRKATLV
tara:strand:+ start:282 stop:449 length:168 start_codon:yes stop_codon:yes gene_type:complete